MGFRDLLFDTAGEPEKKTKPPEPVTVPAPVAVMTVGDSDELYQGLLSRTSFETTTVGELVHKYLSAMESLPLERGMKVRTAIQQAKKLDHVTDEAIIDTFEQMEKALQTQQNVFAKSAMTESNSQILDKQHQVEALSEEIKQKQELIAKLTAEITDAQVRISAVGTRFAAAVRRRVAEIDQEKSTFLAALKG